ncbi:MAG: folate-binding protein YgfZ [Methylobacterium sp.]|nr:folate-binding protein YgfZ [Methylobacterium sp.]
MSQFIPLPERRLLIVAGKDAAHFLHNLLTANIETLKPGQMRPAALLTPQGKIIAEMLVANAGEEGDAEGLFLLDVASGFADPLLEKLGQYKLRAEVSLGHAPAGTAVAVLLDPPDFASDEVYLFADPRHADLGLRLVGPEAMLAAIGQPFERASPEAYHLRRTRLGVPEMGKDYAALDAFPHDVLLDQLAGVDFRKGCYIGQEVVSRMEHRGTARTRALPLRFANGFGVIGGCAVIAGDRAIGTIGECYGDRAIARVRLDRLEEAMASGQSLTAGGVPVVFEKPGFVRFAIPGIP